MCIIVCKPSGKELPDKQTLRNCFSNNKDGAGFSYVKDNRIYLSKGYDRFKPFYRAVKNRIKKKSAAILHFRIASIGEVSRQNCHPFLISECKADINRIELCTSHPVFAHNGNLSIREKSGRSDTRQFARFLGDPVLRDNLFRDNNLMMLVKSSIGFSRMAFMNRKGKIKMLGEFDKEGDLYYSNRTYKYRAIYCRKWDEKKHEWVDDEEEENKTASKGLSEIEKAEERASNLLLEDQTTKEDLKKLVQTEMGRRMTEGKYPTKHTNCEMCDKVGDIFYYTSEDVSLCEICHNLYCVGFEEEEEEEEGIEEVVNGEKGVNTITEITKEGGCK